jgi:hypothetical protein
MAAEVHPIIYALTGCYSAAGEVAHVGRHLTRRRDCPLRCARGSTLS